MSEEKGENPIPEELRAVTEAQKILKFPKQRQEEAPQPKERASTESSKAKFLEAFRNTGVIARAAKEAGINRKTYYDWITDDPEFAELCETAREECIELAEAELHRRGLVKDPKTRDTTALIFWLKKNHPRKYGDETRVKVIGPEEVVKQVAQVLAEHVKDPAQYEELRQALEKLTSG